MSQRSFPSFAATAMMVVIFLIVYIDSGDALVCERLNIMSQRLEKFNCPSSIRDRDAKYCCGTITNPHCCAKSLGEPRVTGAIFEQRIIPRDFELPCERRNVLSHRLEPFSCPDSVWNWDAKYCCGNDTSRYCCEKSEAEKDVRSNGYVRKIVEEPGSHPETPQKPWYLAWWELLTALIKYRSRHLDIE